MKYRVVKANENRQWVVGDIVEVVGDYTGDELELYNGSEPNKHSLIITKPISLNSKLR